MSALGVHAVGWKAPTEPERAHDYLWRIHQQVPGAGELTVFNRSHYEDVLVPVVNGWITPEQQRQRLAHINDFERMLSETGTVIVKFMLHIGFEEQRERLQERLDDPTKHWKFDMGDIAVRKQWADYQKAYETLLAATHTPWAPWTIVPANSKTHRNLMIATVLREVLLKHANVQTPLEVLAAFGGFEIATLVGAVLQAAAERRVIVVDGFIASSAVLVASRLAPAVLQRCVFAHRSGERGHALMLAQLQARPLLDLGLRLGEGSGAALAWPLLVSACTMLREMASFESAGVSEKST